jgi:hypothetical protein
MLTNPLTSFYFTPSNPDCPTPECTFPDWDLSEGWNWECHWLILVLIFIAVGIVGATIAFLCRKKPPEPVPELTAKTAMPNQGNGSMGMQSVNNPAYRPDPDEMEQNGMAGNRVRPMKS